jgi:hypothetical protein
VLAIVAIAVGVDYYAVGGRLGYRDLIVAMAALIGGVIVFGRELGVRYGFVLWILTLALGYRTLALTPELAIHPSELLLWLLVICISFQRRLVASARVSFPVWLWLFIPFCLFAWWPLVGGGISWDLMLNEFRNFALFIPLMIVASVILDQEHYWRYVLLTFFLTSSAIAFMGILEYWFPEVTNLFPAFVTKATPIITEEGFARANFSFWGGAPATFICILALPFGIILSMWWRGWWQRAGLLFALVLQILGIYIGGYRSIWLLLILQVMITCLFRLKRQGAIVVLLCVVFAVGGYELVPRTAERAMSGIAVLRGRPTDSSGRGRTSRAKGALQTAFESPYGSGWGAAGWTHSDFLQVTVNLGIAAGIIFFGGYLSTLFRLWRRVLPNIRNRSEQGDLSLALSLSFAAVGGLLAMEGVSVLPQMALPVWFVWVLVEIWLRQTAEAADVKTLPAPVYAFRLAPTQFSARVKTHG